MNNLPQDAQYMVAMVMAIAISMAVVPLLLAVVIKRWLSK